MAKGGAARGRGTPAGKRRTPAKATSTKPAPRKPAPKNQPAPSASAPLPSGPFRLGVVPGATPGKWIDTWNERMPRTALELIPLTVATQLDPLRAGDADAAIVRLPVDRDGLSIIPLYEEVPVVVFPADAHLAAADDLSLDDLAGEVVITPLDDVLGITVPGAVTPVFAPPDTTEDAIATVATGVGIVIVPMSLARLHARRDVDARPLRDGPVSPVALVWVAERTTPLVDAFVGIVRGRTANSSRG